MTPFRRALLIDLEGTVYQAGRLIAGVPEALEQARSRGIAVRFVTNTTSRPRSGVVAELDRMGLAVAPEAVFTAPLAARDYLLESDLRRCHFLVHPPLLEDFDGIAAVDTNPQAVVVGDLGEGFTFSRLNRAFRLLLEGAELVTLARNRYYRGPDGLLLDVGAFVAALEYGSGRQATLVGKPSSDFFRRALAGLGVPPERAAVVGDDLESDVAGGQQAGMRGVLVRTGKFREGDLAAGTVRPDAVLDSLADLPRVFD